MLKFSTMTALGLVMGLTIGAAGVQAQSQSSSEQQAQGRGSGGMQDQGPAQTREEARQGMPVLVIFVDRDQDQMISEEEAQRANEQLFLILDEDEDQRLTRDEFGGGLTREETARFFQESDRNRDQQLTAREYLESGERTYREQVDRGGRDISEGVSVSEYQESAGITEEEAGLADVDRDERIAPDEAAYDTARRFRMLDQNDDGVVTHTELRQSEMELRRDREFSELDENDDDQLSRDEFMAGTDMGQEGTSFEYRAGQEERRQGGSGMEGAGRTHSNIQRNPASEALDETPAPGINQPGLNEPAEEEAEQ